MRGIISCLTILFICACCAAEEPPKTGDVTLTFTNKSPLSDAAKLTRRGGWSLDFIKKQIDPDYELAKESFSAYIPANYDGTQPYGLFVWISAGPKGDFPAAFKPALDQHHLIWIGANNSGNPRAMLVRMGLALDAVDNMKSQYKIDDERIYIGGISGGGKVATILGVGWPDAFRGGFYIVGCSHYRDVPTGETGHFWPRGFNAPEPKLLTDAKQRNRHVFFTGEKDMNRKPTVGIYEAFKVDKFQHLTLLDLPGVGHELPNAESFEKGVAALDEIPVKETKPVKPR
jgi:predicted esterase